MRFLLIFLMMITFSTQGSDVLAGAKYSIKEMTLQVETALNNRRDRYDMLEDLKNHGVVGENNQGYVEMLEKKPEAENLVNKENYDRRLIYQTIAEQNNLGDALETIEKVFAQVQREKASKGHKIQTEDGEWKKK